MKILITGGCGFVGSELTRFLCSRAWISKIVVVDKGMFGTFHLEPDPKLTIIVSDLKFAFEREFFGDKFDAVVHLSGLSNDPMADFDKNANQELNVNDTKRVYEYCLKSEIKKMIFASSASVYGDIDYILNIEEGNTNPHSNYASSKKEAEDYLLTKRTNNKLNPIIFRKGTIHGISSRMRFDLAVNTMVMSALKYGKIELYGGGENWRPIVDIRDVVRAYGYVLQNYESINKKHSNPIFNICSNNVRISELGIRIADIVGAKLISRYDMPRDVRDYRMDDSKFKSTGFKYIFGDLTENIQNIHQHLNSSKYDYDDPIFYNLRWIKNCQKCFSTIGKEFSLL